MKRTTFPNFLEWSAACTARGFTLRPEGSGLEPSINDEWPATFALDADGQEVGVYQLYKDRGELADAVAEGAITNEEAQRTRDALPTKARAVLFDSWQQFFADTQSTAYKERR